MWKYIIMKQCLSSANSMGNPISQELKEQQAKNDEQTIETLTMMSKMLKNKVAAVAAQLEGAALGDSKLPIVAVVSKADKYMTSVTSQATAGAVDNAIGEVLSGQFLEGLKNHHNRIS